jgi:DNA polymerase III sliding clamp (beta) subunit (PCNA family)
MKATVNIKQFIRIMKALKPFTTEPSPYDKTGKMQYIHFKVDHENGEVKFEALDGHRFAIEYLECEADASFEGYIKPQTLWKTERPEVTITVDEKYTRIDLGWYELKYELPEGEYYSLDTLVNNLEVEKPIKRLGVNPKLLIDALKNLDDKGCRVTAIVEVRSDRKDAILIRDKYNERNIRGVLPVNLSDQEA